MRLLSRLLCSGSSISEVSSAASKATENAYANTYRLRPSRPPRWVDSLRVLCKAGHGGNGFQPRGGHGGKGGNVVFRVISEAGAEKKKGKRKGKDDVDSLYDLFAKVRSSLQNRGLQCKLRIWGILVIGVGGGRLVTCG